LSDCENWGIYEKANELCCGERHVNSGVGGKMRQFKIGITLALLIPNCTNAHFAFF